MRRRDLALGAAIAFPAGWVALHALPVPAQAKLRQIDAVSAPAPDPDRALLALCRRFLSMERRLNLLFERECQAQEDGDKDLERWLAAAQCRYSPYMNRLLEEVMEIPARTTAGLRAKAEVATTTVNTWADGTPSLDHMPLWSICRDLLGHDPGEDAA